MTSPVKGYITSKFGQRKHPITGVESFHNGVDIGCPVGTPVLAPESGRITEYWNHEKGGICLAMVGKDGTRYGFAHLMSRVVRQDDEVHEGQVIAYTGNIGRSTGPHLHFTMRKDGVWVDPLDHIAPSTSPRPSPQGEGARTL